MSDRTVRDWVSRIDKDAKEARNRRIFEMWMACATLEEIGKREDLTGQAVGLLLKEMADLPKLSKSDKAAAEHAVDFDPPIYNIWKQQEKTAGSSHFGSFRKSASENENPKDQFEAEHAIDFDRWSDSGIGETPLSGHRILLCPVCADSGHPPLGANVSNQLSSDGLRADA